MLSVICPVYNEEKYIHQCIDSILSQDYLNDDMEILFVDGMSTDCTREIIIEYAKRYSYIRLIDNPRKIVPSAMNIGIEMSKGDIIVRLDAHVIYPENYFTVLVQKLFAYNADNVGCPCETLPINDSTIAIAIAETLSSPFGVGDSMFRIGVNEDIDVDTVPFGCFKREIFEKVGLYDLDLVRNQDDELNARIINSGGRIVLVSNISVKYYARDTFEKLYKMYYQYGLYKPLVNKKLGRPATFRQLIPPLFVSGLVIGLFGCMLLPVLFYPYLLIVVAYLLVGLYIGLKQSRKHNLKLLLVYMPYSFFVIHWGYGWGYINGLFKVLLNKPFNADVNR